MNTLLESWQVWEGKNLKQLVMKSRLATACKENVKTISVINNGCYLKYESAKVFIIVLIWKSISKEKLKLQFICLNIWINRC